MPRRPRSSLDQARFFTSNRSVPEASLTSVASASGLAFGKDEEMVPVDDFQAKPVEPADLVRKVASLLKSREA